MMSLNNNITTPMHSSRYEFLEQRIESIMDYFDFAKVHKVMEFLDWKWATLDGAGMEIPDVGTLRKRSRELLRDAFGKRCTISTGGFTAIYREGIENDIPWVNLELHFAVETYSNDGEFYYAETAN